MTFRPSQRRTRRYEPPRWLTRAQEEQRDRLADEKYRRKEATRWHAINAALRDQWDALPAERRAELEAEAAAIATKSKKEYLDHQAREQRDRDERNAPGYVSTFGT